MSPPHSFVCFQGPLSLPSHPEASYAVLRVPNLFFYSDPNSISVPLAVVDLGQYNAVRFMACCGLELVHDLTVAKRGRSVSVGNALRKRAPNIPLDGPPPPMPSLTTTARSTNQAPTPPPTAIGGAQSAKLTDRLRLGRSKRAKSISSPPGDKTPTLSSMVDHAVPGGRHPSSPSHHHHPAPLVLRTQSAYAQTRWAVALELALWPDRDAAGAMSTAALASSASMPSLFISPVLPAANRRPDSRSSSSPLSSPVVEAFDSAGRPSTPIMDDGSRPRTTASVSDQTGHLVPEWIHDVRRAVATPPPALEPPARQSILRGKQSVPRLRPSPSNSSVSSSFTSSAASSSATSSHSYRPETETTPTHHSTGGSGGGGGTKPLEKIKHSVSSYFNLGGGSGGNNSNPAPSSSASSSVSASSCDQREPRPSLSARFGAALTRTSSVASATSSSSRSVSASFANRGEQHHHPRVDSPTMPPPPPRKHSMSVTEHIVEPDDLIQHMLSSHPPTPRASQTHSSSYVAVPGYRRKTLGGGGGTTAKSIGGAVGAAGSRSRSPPTTPTFMTTGGWHTPPTDSPRLGTAPADVMDDFGGNNNNNGASYFPPATTTPVKKKTVQTPPPPPSARSPGGHRRSSSAASLGIGSVAGVSVSESRRGSECTVTG
jgi:hypothetical protein